VEIQGVIWCGFIVVPPLRAGDFFGNKYMVNHCNCIKKKMLIPERNSILYKDILEKLT